MLLGRQPYSRAQPQAHEGTTKEVAVRTRVLLTVLKLGLFASPLLAQAEAKHPTAAQEKEIRGTGPFSTLQSGSPQKPGGVQQGADPLDAPDVVRDPGRHR